MRGFWFKVPNSEFGHVNPNQKPRPRNCEKGESLSIAKAGWLASDPGIWQRK